MSKKKVESVRKIKKIQYFIINVEKFLKKNEI